MGVEGEPPRYEDRTVLESFFEEQQDDEMSSSPMSSSSREASFMEKERRIRDEIQQFEALERQLRSHKYNQRSSPMTHTTMIETEAYFRMNESGSEMTKRFYHNEFSSEKKENSRFSQIIPVETTDEPDYIEEEYTITFQDGDFPYQTNEDMSSKTTDQPEQISFSSPGKSILKKPGKEQAISARSLSPSYSNEILNSVQLTANPTRSQSQEELAVWYTYSDQHKPSSYRKQHISWSPTGNPIPKPSWENHKTREAFYASSPNLHGTSHVSPAAVVEEKKIFFPSPIPEIVDVPPPGNKEHTETAQSYDRLLEKMRETDEQLQSPLRSGTNTAQQRRTIGENRPMKSKELISPVFLQTCLLLLIIFNLLVVYFFNDINFFWNHYFSHSPLFNHRDDGKFSYW